MTRVTITNANDSLQLLRLLAQGWEYGHQARKIRKPCGMTGTLRGDRAALDESAARSVGCNFEDLLTIVTKKRTR